MVPCNCHPVVTGEGIIPHQTHNNVVYRKMQVHLKPYTPEKKIKPPELYKKDCNHSVNNNQSVNNTQRPKHSIKPPNRLNLY